MKIGKIFLLLACLIITMSFMAQSASAGCATIPGLEPIGTDPNASGTKLSGTLTIYADPGIAGTLYYFVRLKQGVNLYLFSGSDTFVGSWLAAAQDIIELWFENTIIPYIAWGPGVPGPFTGSWGLKSYSLDVLSGTDPGDTDGMNVSVMDVVVAFQE